MAYKASSADPCGKGGAVGGVTLDVRDRIAHISIEGGNHLNILTLELIHDLVIALEDFRDRHDAHVAVLSGAGDHAFSAGGDLKGPLTTHPEEFTPKTNRDQFWWPRSGFRDATRRLINFENDKPVIAAINGYCLGIALIFVSQQTDIRIAGTNATFGLTETQRGLCGGAASAQLGRHMSLANEMYLTLTGNSIDAKEAWRIGFVNFVVKPEHTLDRANEVAAQIARLPIQVIKAEREGVLRGRDLDRAGAWRLAQALYTIQVQEEDAYVGAADFLAHR
jgi:enoyl-CoA hydratase/carnithine racemase